jgi:hypothetical protein
MTNSRSLKMSYNATDNGYAVFNNVRIPRTNLLSRHATVSRDGKYATVALREKLVYGGMLKGRSVSKSITVISSWTVSTTDQCMK